MNISDYKQVPLSTILGDLALYKYNPGKIIDVSLDRLSDMLNGKIDIVDPSNPFTYLLETSCLNTAFAIQEYALLTRKLYPRLANNEQDLYLHMSDYDYLGRFSEPSTAPVTVNILYNGFKSNAILDPVSGDYVFKLPRHYKITVGNQIFTLLYPVIIRETRSGIIDVRYDNGINNEVQVLSTDYIEYFVLNQFNNEKYIIFTLRLLEVDIESVEIPIEKSKLFKNTFNFNAIREFYHAEAYYYDQGQWNKMLVTHTNQVYDINTPTMIVNVRQDAHVLDCYVPPVYVNNNRVGSKVKILIYTTKGYIDVNFNDYQLGDFVFEYNPVFRDTDMDIYTTPLELISKVVLIKDRVVGGKNRMDFDTLKDKVITNSIGDRKTPVTDKQLEFLSEQNNFTLIKGVDTLTHRLYDLQAKVPRALTRYPITKLNLDILEYTSTIAEMIYNGTVKAVSDYRYAIPKNTIFTREGGSLRLLSSVEKANIDALEGISLVNDLNNHFYYSTFFHYILDTSKDVTVLRAYSLDAPRLNNINFKHYNSTTEIGANTSSFTISKQESGYLLEVATKVTVYNNGINFSNIIPYIVYESEHGSRYYIAGTLLTVVNDVPIYHFYLSSLFDIDEDNNLWITNFKDVNSVSTPVSLGLTTRLQLLYLSDTLAPHYTNTQASSIVNDSYLAGNYFLITQEELNLELGKELKYLKRNTHNSTTLQEYQTHIADVPMTYTSNVYDDNDVIINQLGDVVLDGDGNTVYKYTAGDNVLDFNGNPVPIGNLETARYFNFLFIDYKALRANNKLVVDYVNYLRDYLVEVITFNTATIYEQLLENTEAYVTVPKNLDYIEVRKDSQVVSYMPSQQSFIMTIYVTTGVYNDINTKDNINYTVISTIENYLTANSKISKSELISTLFNNLKEFVQSISFTKFTSSEAEYIEILNDSASFTFNKVFLIESDGSYSLKEDIVISYVRVD
jgi:hypothetical protein